MTGPLFDSHGRAIRDLRISITDRCNFRCVYCLPENEEAANFYQNRFSKPAHRPGPIPSPGANPTAPASHPVETGEAAGLSRATDPLRTFKPAWKPRAEILSYEEIERVAAITTRMGIRKLRVTGGEPLMRKGVDDLVRRLAALPGVEDIAMTTNGFHFRNRGAALRAAGLNRVSFSLDSLDPANFKRMTGRDGCLEVLGAIQAARSLGFDPVKINAVVIRGLNDHEIEGLVEFAISVGCHMRFIEFMPLDSGHAWKQDLVVPGREILARLAARFPLLPATDPKPGETAKRWTIAGTQSHVGIIAPVTEPFCGHCNRIRLTADGKIRTCLFSHTEHDLRPWLRGGCSDVELTQVIRDIVLKKEDRHHIGEPEFQQPARTMSCIGG